MFKISNLYPLNLIKKGSVIGYYEIEIWVHKDKFIRFISSTDACEPQ